MDRIQARSGIAKLSDDKEQRKSESFIRFTENKKQWEESILFKASLDGGAMFFSKKKLTYHFYDKDSYRELHANPKAKFKELKSCWFFVHFLGANDNSETTGKNPDSDYNNYFIGNDRAKWAYGVKNFKEIYYTNTWDGIDLQFLGKENSLKYNFIVKPGANPSSIKLKYEGVKKISLVDGEIQLETKLNSLTEHKPFAYQYIQGKKTEVPCRFVMKKNIVSYEFPNGYNNKYELVIDPVLVFACSSGSLSDNFGMTATYDSQGNLYSGGTAFDVGFPVINAFDSTYNGTVGNGITDVVITKYDSSGTFLHYSTYIGGAAGTEIVSSLIVDGQNNLLLYGTTGSSDFPVSGTAFDTSFNGGSFLSFPSNGTIFNFGTDIFVSKLSPTGTALLASTYIGGSENDGVNHTNFQVNPGQFNYDSLQFNYSDQYRGEIQCDANGNVYISSSTRSNDFPIVNGFDNSIGGAQDAILFKLNSSLSVLDWSTYLGGSKNDAGYALSLDVSNNVYVTGGTCSTDFPTTTGSYQPNSLGGKADAFVSKIKFDGSLLLHSSYYGTFQYDQSFFIQQDDSGSVYLFGQTQGTIPVINASYSTASGRQFVAKIDSTLSTLQMQTVFGNGLPNINICPSAFLVDCSGNIYMSGWGGSILTNAATFNMPLTSNAHQSVTDGFNFYLMVLSRNASSLLYATYFGGGSSREHVDGGTSRFDKKGIIYQSVCAGCGGFDDFPVSPGAWPSSVFGNDINQALSGGKCNNGTFKFNFEFAVPKAQLSASSVSGCAPLTVQFTNNSVSAIEYFWNFGNNDTTSQVFNPVKTFTTPGTYTVSLAANNMNCFNVWDTAFITITVYPKPDADFSVVIDTCTNNYSFLNNSQISTGNNSYLWNLGNGNSSSTTNVTATYDPGSYLVALIATSDKGCKDTIVKPVLASIIPDSISPPYTFCPETNQPVSFFVSGGNSYQWFPASGLNNSTSANPTAFVLSTTSFSVVITETDGQGNTCKDTLGTAIIIYPAITANFNSLPINCGNTLQFTDLSQANPSSWTWSFGDGVSDTTQNPVHTYLSPGTYSVVLSTENNFGCSDSVTQTITVGGFNPVSINATTVVCKGEVAQLFATGGIAYEWFPTTGLSDSTIANPLAQADSNTVYSVNIYQINSSGDTCVTSLSTSVLVSNLNPVQLLSSANPDTIIKGESSSITSNLGSPYSIVWSPANTLNNANSFNPTASPTSTTTYIATVSDTSGCTFLLSEVTIYVITNECVEGSIFVPNTFTPNGDGKNDVLFVRSNFTSEIYFAVYNRWGERVFETEDILKGWDGTFKGMKSDPGVFGYYVRFKCNNGEESFKKGNITLIR